MDYKLKKKKGLNLLRLLEMHNNKCQQISNQMYNKIKTNNKIL